MDIDNSDRHEWFSRAKILANLGKLESANACYDRAIALKPNYYEAWCEKGEVLEKMGFLEKADVCFNEALRVFAYGVEESLEDDILTAIPATDKASSFYNKACFHALQNNLELAIANLQEAIKLHPSKYCSMVDQDSDFAEIRGHEKFKSLNIICKLTSQ